MAALVESSEDPVIGLTLEGVITDWNPAAERLYGYSAEEALGASIAMLVPPERRGGSGSLLATVRSGETVRQIDTQRMAKDGRRIDVSISMGLSAGETEQRLRLPKGLKPGTYVVKITFKAKGTSYTAAGTAKVALRQR